MPKSLTLLKNHYRSLAKVDKILLRMAYDSDDKIEKFLMYIYKKFFLKKNIYPFVGENIPGHTKHDYSHIIGVLDNIYKIINSRLEFRIDENTGNVILNKDYKNYRSNHILTFNFYDLFYLLMAGIYHDTGLIIGRKNHGENIKKVIGLELCNKYYGQMLKDIYNIAKVHTGVNAIDDLKSPTIHTSNNIEINQQFLAALLRIADEFHENPIRTNELVWEEFIAKKSKMYHVFSQIVKEINFIPDKSTITLAVVIRFKNHHNSIFKKRLMRFIIDRLEKYLNQMKYCLKFDIKKLFFETLIFETIYYDKSNIQKSKKFVISDDESFANFKLDFINLFQNEIL